MAYRRVGRSSVWAAGNSPTEMRTPGRSQGGQGLNGPHYARDNGHYLTLPFFLLTAPSISKYILFIRESYTVQLAQVK